MTCDSPGRACNARTPHDTQLVGRTPAPPGLSYLAHNTVFALFFLPGAIEQAAGNCCALTDSGGTVDDYAGDLWQVAWQTLCANVDDEQTNPHMDSYSHRLINELAVLAVARRLDRTLFRQE